uniref:Prothymosin alpha-like n=1 Tax=Xenopus tropicalis TaxID=8364 RepID=A0A803J6I1_XENTR
MRGGARTRQEWVKVRESEDLKEKKEVVEEPEKAENGKGDAPSNGTEENGADHGAQNDDAEEEDEEGDVEGEGEGEGEEEEDEEEGEGDENETDGLSVKRPAEDEEKTETKKQKTENGDSTEVKESA